MTRTRLFLRKTLINIFYYRGPFESRPGNNRFTVLANSSSDHSCITYIWAFKRFQNSILKIEIGEKLVYTKINLLRFAKL